METMAQWWRFSWRCPPPVRSWTSAQATAEEDSTALELIGNFESALQALYQRRQACGPHPMPDNAREALVGFYQQRKSYSPEQLQQHVGTVQAGRGPRRPLARSTQGRPQRRRDGTTCSPVRRRRVLPAGSFRTVAGTGWGTTGLALAVSPARPVKPARVTAIGSSDRIQRSHSVIS